jgi:tyrosinase
MGENETAGLDPIFFFHHCNVDRIFWMWQVRHKSTDELDLTVPGWEGPGVYPGQNNVNNQPPVGYEQEEQLTMESPLYPFKLVENGVERNFCSADVVNIEKQLGLKYESLSLDNNDGESATIKAIAKLRGLKALAPKSDKALVIDGINRAKINGSFVLSAFATIDGNRYFIGSEPVLSRWKVTACKNCMTNLEVTATFSLADFTEDEINRAIFDVQINGRKHNDVEFNKFTVTNNANATRMLSAANATTAKFMNLMAAPAAAQVPTAHSKAFHLSVV